MSTPQRASGGFHRLGLFLAAVPLLVGGVIACWGALSTASERQQSIECAHKLYQRDDGRLWKALVNAQESSPRSLPPDFFTPVPRVAPKPWGIPRDTRVNLRDVYCANYSVASFDEIVKPPRFAWSAFAASFVLHFSIILVVVIAIYSIVRAVSWVVSVLGE
jgi:hypothetical protein